MAIVKVGVAGRRAHIGMTEQFADHRQGFGMGGGMAGKAVPQIVDTNAGKARFVTQFAPQVADIGDRALGSRVPENVPLLLPARQGVEDRRGGLGQPDRARAGLAVGQQQAPSPHLAPLEAGRAEKSPPSQEGGIPWDEDFREAIEAEFSTSSEALVDLAPALLQLAEKRGEGAFTIKRSEIAAWLEGTKDYPQGNFAAMLERLTLKRRENWGKEEDWLIPRDLDLSRFDRPNSLINRPLLALSDGDDPVVLIAPMIISDALMYAVGTMHEGSMHGEFWSSSEARKYAGRRADELGREFEDEVAATLNGLGLQASTRRTVNDLLQQGSDTDLGDVDVFAISTDQSKVWVIEAKNLRLCRTESEVAARMTEYRGQSRTDRKGGERPDKMLRHLNRVRHLRHHAQELGQCLGLPTVPEVVGLMVVDAPQPMNFHMLDYDPDSQSCMLDDLGSVV